MLIFNPLIFLHNFKFTLLLHQNNKASDCFSVPLKLTFFKVLFSLFLVW